MSGRIFQNIVLQFKETTDTVIGVIDSEGTVIACTDLPEIGQRWPHLVQPINEAEGACTALEGKTFKALEGWGGQFDFAAFTRGEDALSSTVCSMATVALNTAKSYYEEKHDKTSFVKSILSDNILLSDIYVRAKELHVEAELNRGVFVIRRTDEKADAIPVETVQNIFPDRQTSFVLSMGEDDVVLVQQLGDNVEMSDLEKTAAQIEETLRVNGESTVVVGIGTVATHLRDLAKSYKEAQMAIEVGKVFDTEKYIISYENLGIGRLIYQLPTTLCEMFLSEAFKKNPIEALDEDFDLLICGKMAVDGDTAQIGPELAGAFEIPCVTDVSCVQSAGFTTCGALSLVHGCDAGEETVYLEMPCAMTTAKEIGQLRMPSIAGIRAAEEADVRVVNAADVNADPARCGLAGSPTQVVRSFVPDRDQTCEAVDGTASEQAAKLAKIIEGMA